MIDEKKCSSCEVVLPISEFYADKSKSCGYKSSCKNCVKSKKRNKSSKKSNKTARSRRTKLEIENSSTDVSHTCVSCNQQLPLDNFYIRNGKPVHNCKSCQSDVRKVRYQEEKENKNSEEQEAEMSKKLQAEKLSIALQALAQMRSGIRKCNTCQIWRDESEFRSRSRSISGVANKCSHCMKNDTKEAEQSDMFVSIKTESDLRMQRIIKETLRKKGLL